MKTLAALLLLLPALAFAGWMKRSGESSPDTDASKSVGEFGAQLVLVADERELINRWREPSETVEVKTVSKVEKNCFINAFVVFGGCAPDSSGNCSVTMQFRVLRPDGATYAETPAMEVWKSKPQPLNKSLGLSVGYLKIRIEPHDPLGQYTIETQVKDENSGVALQLKGPFTAMEGGNP